MSTIPSAYPLRLEGEFDEPVSRWLWLVKWLLAIPHLIVLFFLWIAFVVLTVVAGFAILFTGRYPRGIFDFNVGVSFLTSEQFDASWDRGQPFEFKLGKGQVIPGWDQGVAGMKVGGLRRLTIPSAMAYGARGAGGVIKPHEPLVFVVDLLGVD